MSDGIQIKLPVRLETLPPERFLQNPSVDEIVEAQRGLLMRSYYQDTDGNTIGINPPTIFSFTNRESVEVFVAITSDEAHERYNEASRILDKEG